MRWIKIEIKGNDNVMAPDGGDGCCQTCPLRLLAFSEVNAVLEVAEVTTDGPREEGTYR